MSGKGSKPNPHASERLDVLKQQQCKWLEQRSTSLREEKKKNNCDVQSPKKHSSTSLPRKTKNVDNDKKSATLLWASSSCSNDYTGFVVRKPNLKEGNRSSRPVSAKSSVSVKNEVHENKTNISQNKNKVMLKDNKIKGHIRDENSNISEVDDDIQSIKSEDTTDMNLPDYSSTSSECDIYLNHFRTDDMNSNTSDTFTQVNSMSNHCCPICKEVMIGQCAPHIVIPCGHSFCSLCLSGEMFCLLCRNKISSVEENLTMCKIICHFQMKKKEEEVKKREADARKYVDEYQSLSTRTDAMKEEAAIIIDNMENITHQILGKKKSIRSIVEEAGATRKEIEELHEKLSSLEVQCTEENEAVKTLDDEYDSCKTKLVLAEKTIKILEQSQERVKMIVEDLLPSLNLDS